MTEEDLATLKEDGEESWKSELADIMEEQFGVGEDASDEDKTAAWADAVAYVADQYGITEEEYLEEYLKYGKIEYIYNTVYGMASENVNPTDEEVKAYFTQLVDEDREVLLSFAGGDELGEEDTVEALVSAYEFYTMYYGYSFLYMPEGYRGITHILLKVDDTLMSS